MSASVSERLIHNLLYSQAVVVYCETTIPVNEQLELLSEHFNLAYLNTKADDDISSQRTRLVHQLFGNPLFNPKITLIELFSELDDGESHHAIIIRNFFSAELLSELIAVDQFFGSRVRLIYEVPPVRAVELLKRIEQAGRQALLLGEAKLGSEENKVTFADLISQETRSNSGLWLKLMLLTALLFGSTFAVYYYLVLNKDSAITEQKPSVVTPEPASTPDQTALPIADPLDTELTASITDDTQPVELEQALQNELNEITDLDQEKIAPQIPTDIVATAPPENTTNNQSDSAIVKEVEAEQPKPSNSAKQKTDWNAWLTSANPKHYVIQLTVVSTEKLLKQYLESVQVDDGLKVYQFDQRFAVVYGDFNSIKSARNAISDLPKQVTDAGAWPKSIASIQQRISQQ